jgi:hypothetical protein
MPANRPGAYRLGSYRMNQTPGYDRVTAPLQPLLGVRMSSRLNNPTNPGYNRNAPLNGVIPPAQPGAPVVGGMASRLTPPAPPAASPPPVGSMARRLDDNGNPLPAPAAPAGGMASRLGQSSQYDQGAGPFPHTNPDLRSAAQGYGSLSNLGVSFPQQDPVQANVPGSPINQQRTLVANLNNGVPLNPQVRAYTEGLQGTPQERQQKRQQTRYSQMLEDATNRLTGPTYAGRQSRLDSLSSRLSQPRQNLDGAAALQGRLTATGAQYPTDVAQGPQQPAFQPQSGTYGRSTVSVSPEGRATVTGDMGSRELTNYGVQRFAQDDGTTGRYTAEQTARLAANRNRMENQLLSRRLGQSYDPGNPIPAGQGDPSVYQARIGDLRQDADRLRNPGRLSQQLNQGQSVAQGDPLARHRQSIVNNLLDPRREAVPTVDEAMDYGTRLSNFIENGPQAAPSAGGNNTGNVQMARDLIQGITDPVEAERVLTEQQFDPAVIQQLLQPLTQDRTPAQQQADERELAAQRFRRQNPVGSPGWASAPTGGLSGNRWNILGR